MNKICLWVIISIFFSVFQIIASDIPQKANDKNIKIAKNLELQMRLITPGTFTMGTPKKRLVKIYDEVEHKVTITDKFWIGKFEITQKQFKALMGYNPSFFKKDDNLPVENISWQEAMNFCKTLNKRFYNNLPPGYHFSLPTEAQWEYACKAGLDSDFNNGKNLSNKNRCKKANQVSWNKLNSNGTTHTVGLKKPNKWGIYDMHGNVWEMCLDWYAQYNGDAKDPQGPAHGVQKVVRGGSFDNIPRYGRTSDRHLEYPCKKMKNMGFRIVLTRRVK